MKNKPYYEYRDNAFSVEEMAEFLGIKIDLSNASAGIIINIARKFYSLVDVID